MTWTREESRGASLAFCLSISERLCVWQQSWTPIWIWSSVSKMHWLALSCWTCVHWWQSSAAKITVSPKICSGLQNRPSETSKSFAPAVHFSQWALCAMEFDRAQVGTALWPSSWSIREQPAPNTGLFTCISKKVVPDFAENATSVTDTAGEPPKKGWEALVWWNFHRMLRESTEQCIEADGSMLWVSWIEFCNWINWYVLKTWGLSSSIMIC